MVTAAGGPAMIAVVTATDCFIACVFCADRVSAEAAPASKNSFDLTIGWFGSCSARAMTPAVGATDQMMTASGLAASTSW